VLAFDAPKTAYDWRAASLGIGTSRKPVKAFGLTKTPPGGDIFGQERLCAVIQDSPWWTSWTPPVPELTGVGWGRLDMRLPDPVLQTRLGDVSIDVRQIAADIFIVATSLAPAELSAADAWITAWRRPVAVTADIVPDMRTELVGYTGTQDQLAQAVSVADQTLETVADVATSIKQVSGLSDSQIAGIFPAPVARETFLRWRHGSAERPTEANLRRLGLLKRLFDDLAERVTQPRTWLLALGESSGATPYELLRAGRLADVENMVALLPSPAQPEGAIDAEGHRVAPHVGPMPHDHTPDQMSFTDFGVDQGEWAEAEDDEDSSE
jgi:hypothetical protein